MNRADAIAGPRLADRVPPHAYFLVSAVFHYLGPAFAVMLFAAIEPLGVAWLRIASAALIFAVWEALALLARADCPGALDDRRPWRRAGGDEFAVLPRHPAF